LSFFYQDLTRNSWVVLFHVVDKLYPKCFVFFIKFSGNLFLFFSEMREQILCSGLADMREQIISVQKQIEFSEIEIIIFGIHKFIQSPHFKVRLIVSVKSDFIEI